MRHLLLAATGLAALSGSAALAQTTAPATGAVAAPAPAAAAPAASGPTVGATVYDAQGNEVGKIEAVDAQNATLATTKSKVRLPLASFGTSPKGPTLGMTAAEVDAAAGPQGQAAAGSAAGGQVAGATPGPAGAPAPVKLTKGATVSDGSGARVGTIEEVSGDFAVVATAKNKVRLPLNAFADNGKGPVIGMTEAELDAAAASAAKPKSGG